MRVGDLVKFKDEKRMGIILTEHTVEEGGSKEYSVRWFPSTLGKSRVRADLLELASKVKELISDDEDQ